MKFLQKAVCLSAVMMLSACGGGGGDSGGGSGGGGSSVSYTPYACSSAVYEQAMNLRIYQVMTEAFLDTDGTGYGVGYGTSHHRGDLEGVRQALPYIKSLGMNAIWLTPVFESVPLSGQDIWADRLDATGYFATNYFAIDPQFGTLAEARALVDRAHELGLYVFFDGVFGHFKANADTVTSPEGRTLSDDGAAQAATGREAVYPDDLAYFKEVATYWIEELNIDGWRLDQAYQVPVGAWGEIRKAVEDASAAVTYELEGSPVNPLGYMVAEVWDGESGIAANAYGTASQPGLCSAFDFPMRYRIVQAFAGEESGADDRNASTLAEGYQTQSAYPSFAVPNGFITNHDLVRFGDLMQRERLADPADATYWLRYQAAYAFLASYSGPITLYYGDEIGDQVDGFDDRENSSTCAAAGLCDDHVARTSGRVEGLATTPGESAFSASPDQEALRDRITSLMTIRADHPALYRGSLTEIVSNEGEAVYVSIKRDGADQVLFLVNLTEQTRFVNLDSGDLGSMQATDLESAEVLNAIGSTLTVELQPLQARFFSL